MAGLTGSVGKAGQNSQADVLRVQRLLNVHAATLGKPTLIVDGDCGGETIRMIEAYQRMVVGLTRPDGRIDPGGRTWTLLSRGEAVTPPPPPPGGSQLSGAAWWHANQSKFPNSNKLADLTPPFREKATSFFQALRQAGANISISSTLRHPNRAYLMHWCWKISKGLVQPSAVPRRTGVDIVWDHGSLAASKRAAAEMRDLFGMAHIAALTSNHISGEAVDMTISWAGTLNVVDAAGAAHAIGAPRNGAANAVLHRVGRSFGVRKLIGDDPHWSLRGN
jgi:hypothetical protein